jgi:7-cyano-7-deazaguanine synthase
MKNGLLIYSGGMDSTVLLHQYLPEIALCISFDYGSKHNEKEIEMAKYNTAHLNVEHIIIPLAFIKQYFHSSLLEGNIPEGHYEDESMRSTVVPFRNGIMLSIVIGLAESKGLEAVYIANHAGDHAIYPDCRNTFIGAIKEAAYHGTYNHIKIISPYVDKTKREIALIGQGIKVDFTETYSCYKGGNKHCGVCGTCVERKEALVGFDETRYVR